ncbi:MAG: T9SS type A sorting domain-containing protein [Bacteroidota bacterium]|jgi:hypothetical protein
MKTYMRIVRRASLVILLVIVIGTGSACAQNLKITGGTALKISGDASLIVQGTFTNNGTFTPGPNTVMTFSGIDEYINGATAFTNLSKTGGGTLTLNDPISVSGTLTLDNGLILLGNSHLTLGDGASIAGTPSASAMIVTGGTGELRKGFSGTGSFIFPVGDATGTAEYSPATLNFTSGSFSSAYASVRAVNSKHPQNSSVTNFIDRYWVLSSTGITGFNCDVACTYVPADVHGTESVLFGGAWDGSLWTLLSAVNPSTHSFSTSLATLGEFSAGESSAVPVELVAFSGSVLDPSHVRLRWKTATELNCFGFEIQRMREDDANLEWSTLAFTEGQGTKHTPSNYAFVDALSKPVYSETSFHYRLRQIDRDGSVAHSPIITVHFGNRPVALRLEAPWPNPAVDHATIAITIEQAHPVTLTVHNSFGAEVSRICDGTPLDRGMHVLPVSTGDLPTGIYIVRLLQGEESRYVKFVVAK